MAGKEKKNIISIRVVSGWWSAWNPPIARYSQTGKDWEWDRVICSFVSSHISINHAGTVNEWMCLDSWWLPGYSFSGWVQTEFGQRGWLVRVQGSEESIEVSVIAHWKQAKANTTFFFFFKHSFCTWFKKKWTSAAITLTTLQKCIPEEGKGKKRPRWQRKRNGRNWIASYNSSWKWPFRAIVWNIKDSPVVKHN